MIIRASPKLRSALGCDQTHTAGLKVGNARQSGAEHWLRAECWAPLPTSTALNTTKSTAITTLFCASHRVQDVGYAASDRDLQVRASLCVASCRPNHPIWVMLLAPLVV